MNRDVCVKYEIRRGDIFIANLNPAVGSEQQGVRPVIVVSSNEEINVGSNTVIVAPLSSSKRDRHPFHVVVTSKACGIDKSSLILTEQIRTIDKTRLIKKVAVCPPNVLNSLNEALKVSLKIK